MCIVVVICGEKVVEVKVVGVEFVGEEDLVESISKGEMDFDLLIVIFDMMFKVVKLGWVFGLCGLMFNFKVGIVIMDFEFVIKEFKVGKLEFCVDCIGIVYVCFGKVSFSVDVLL